MNLNLKALTTIPLLPGDLSASEECRQSFEQHVKTYRNSLAALATVADLGTLANPFGSRTVLTISHQVRLAGIALEKCLCTCMQRKSDACQGAKWQRVQAEMLGMRRWMQQLGSPVVGDLQGYIESCSITSQNPACP